jgi:uncharacterized membrane protein YeaQ/YmgE (transglycosylase-associated protein family)
MQGIIGLIIEIIAGVIGGNAAGAAAKNASLGTAGNSIAGGIGGLVLGQILGALGIGEPGMATAEGAAPAGAGFDIGAPIALPRSSTGPFGVDLDPPGDQPRRR